MQLNQFCGAGILGRQAVKRASGRSTFLKVSLLTDDPIAVTSHFHQIIDLRLTRAVKINHSQRLQEPGIPEGSGSNLVPRAFPSHFLREKPWGRGWIRKELLLKSTIKGVVTRLAPHPFPSLFFLLTSFSECSLHSPYKINARFRGNAQILLQIAVLFAVQKLHGSAGRM